MAASPKSHEDYTVGWICALPKELTAARLMLDEEHPNLPKCKGSNDANTYILGAVGPHNVAITVLPMNCYGTNQAARAAAQMLSTFPSIKIGLLVGIGAGFPSKVNLGDVVISTEWAQWDFGKANDYGIFEYTGRPFLPPDGLLSVMGNLKSKHHTPGTQIPQYIDALKSKHPDLAPKLSIGCPKNVHVHYGMIASGNQVVKDANLRESIDKRLRGKVYCIEMEAAGLVSFPAVVIRGICDYADSNKNDDWQEYAATMAAACAKEFLHCAQPYTLNDLKIGREDLSKALNEIATLRQSLSERKDRKILEWLTPLDYTSQQNDFFNRQEAGTGEWLLNSSEYQNWLHTAKEILFCPGMPGAGKTILTSIVINDLTHRYAYNQFIGIAYIYFNFKGSVQMRVDDVLLSLLKQLSETQPSLPKCVKELHDESKGTSRPSRKNVVGALQKIVANYSRVFIIFDALDEYHQEQYPNQVIIKQELPVLLDVLFKLHGEQSINIFATSRYIPEIRKKFAGISTECEIRASDEDVRKYLEAQISRLPTEVHRDNKQFIKDEIVKKVQGMFLLAQLHLEAIRPMLTLKKIKHVLGALGLGDKAYDCAYEEAMRRITKSSDNESIKIAYQLLSWITCASRPLTKPEILHAIAVEFESEEYDLEKFEPGEHELDKDNIPKIEDMVALCAGLITIDEESNIVRLVHYTTHEYFQRNQQRWFPWAHTNIAKICVIYLSYKTFQTGPGTRYSDYIERLKSNPLYTYAARNFGFHVQQSENDDAHHIEPNSSHRAVCSTKLADINTLILKFLLKDNLRPSCIEAILGEDGDCLFHNYPIMVSELHIVAYNGLTSAAKQILADRHRRWIKMESKDSAYDQTPLLWAAKRGNANIVELLLANGADTGSKDNHGRTSLSLAAKHENVVELLLAKGADTESKDKYGQTPLSWAAECGNANIVELLLAKGADTESKDKYGQTPLSWAARCGNANIVELLLANGADTESIDKNGQTPLSLVAKLKNANIVELLLAKGADTESKDKYGQTPLSLAAECGNANVVELLLAKGADTESKDKYGQTPLSWAAGCGNANVVELLLANGADTESIDKNGQTPLSLAAKLKNANIVELLLAKGADTESKDDDGRTPLSWAAGDGCKVAASEGSGNRIER